MRKPSALGDKETASGQADNETASGQADKETASGQAPAKRQTNQIGEGIAKRRHLGRQAIVDAEVFAALVASQRSTSTSALPNHMG